MQVTINHVRSAVNAALDTAFPDIPVSGGETQPVPPQFVVQLLNTLHTQELGRRYRRSYPFVVRYFSSQQTNDDMYDMAEQLTSALQSVIIGGRSCPGHGMNFQIDDGVLNFFVTFSLLVWEQQPDVPKMQNLDQEVEIDE